MIAIGKTDIGKKRQSNEDAFFLSIEQYGPLPNFYVVADGMGGHQAGYCASHSALEYLEEFVKDHRELALDSDQDVRQFLKRAINHANYQLFKKASAFPEYKGMGTTLTIATMIEGQLYVAHVGDSRLYAISQDQIIQVTRDHSLVQEMVSKGYITKEEAKKHPDRHIITRAVGTYEKVKVDTYNESLQGVDYIFLCSDGITTMLSDKEIHAIMIGNQDLEHKANRLVDFANDRGGLDNVTVVLAVYDKVVKVC